MKTNTAPKKPSDAELAQMVGRVKEACETIPYVLINEIQEKRRSKIPDYVAAASWLMAMLIRSNLHANFMATGMDMVTLNTILDKIRLKYSQALIEPGSAVGIIAAQSFSEPLTQYMLDAHHRSASGGTSKSSMIKAKEILGAKDVDRLDSPSMMISLLPEIETNISKVQEIANNIEVMKLRQFVVLWQVFFEKFGEPTHPQYKEESKMVGEFMRANPLLTQPGDLIKWCLRIVLNKTTLILKNMSLELIITRLRETYPDLYIVYTPENVKQIVIRVYFRNAVFKGHVETGEIETYAETLLNTIVRGVDGIVSTEVKKVVRNKVDESGAIVKKDNVYAIVTNGTNLSGIYRNKFVDVSRVQTDAIKEIERVLGIEAARQKIISELRNLVDSCYHAHYLVYADEMTYTGKVTSIERGGLSHREASNILLRIGFSSPIQTLEEAALNSSEDSVTGVTAPLLLGSVPRVGTLYNKFIMDGEFISKNVRKPDDWIEELL
jgi:DNA-directed RNA polymerase beta' subunit